MITQGSSVPLARRREHWWQLSRFFPHSHPGNSQSAFLRQDKSPQSVSLAGGDASSAEPPTLRSSHRCSGAPLSSRHELWALARMFSMLFLFNLVGSLGESKYIGLYRNGNTVRRAPTLRASRSRVSNPSSNSMKLHLYQECAKRTLPTDNVYIFFLRFFSTFDFF